MRRGGRGGDAAALAALAPCFSTVVDLGTLVASSSGGGGDDVEPYAFRLAVVDAAGFEGAATLAVAVNTAPRDGALAISPADGLALTDAFVFAATGWVDDLDDFPRARALGVVVGALADAAPVDDAAFVALGDAQALASRAGVLLPAGDAAANGTLTGVARVSDRLGAVGAARARARVTAASWSADALEQAAESALADALALGDADGVAQLAAAVVSLVAPAASGGAGAGGGANGTAAAEADGAAFEAAVRCARRSSARSVRARAPIDVTSQAAVATQTGVLNAVCAGPSSSRPRARPPRSACSRRCSAASTRRARA